MQSLILDPLIPTALWLVLAFGGAGLLTWYARTSQAKLSRGRWLTTVSLMAIALVLPLAILLNPTWLETIPPPAGKPLLTVFVDGSGSMATADATASDDTATVDDGQTRYQAAIGIAKAMQQLDDQYEVRVRRFDSTSATTSIGELETKQPEGNLTDIDRAIEEVLHEDRPQGQAVLLLSDGIHNAGGSARAILKTASKAKAIATPIFSKTIGGKSDVKNLSIQPLTPQQLTFVSQKVPVIAELAHQGLSGRTVDVRLFRDDQQLDQQQVDLDSTGRTEVQFQITEDANGLYRYRMEVAPLGEEVTPADNRATLLMRVIDQPIRVLLLEGKPYWDSKFLMRKLAADPSIEMVSVVRVADQRLMKRTLYRDAPAGGDPASPSAEGKPEVDTTLEDPEAGSPAVERLERWEIINNAADVLADGEELSRYQIVVLGRDAEVFLGETAVDNLRNWISRDGGSLVCSRGAPAAQINERLGRLMPVLWTRTRESRFRVALTEAGRELRWLPGQQAPAAADPLVGMPSLSTAEQVKKTKPLAIVLATSVSKDGTSALPVVSYQQYGTGRVVVVEGAGMWRWAFMPPNYADQETVYATLWHSLTRWLVSRAGLLPGQPLAMQSDKVSFSTTETATATLLMREASASGQLPRIELSGPALAEPKEFTPKPLGDDPGVYRVVFGSLEEGQYQVRTLDDPAQSIDRASSEGSTAFDVRSPWSEKLDVDARPDLMKRIAETSGGAMLDAADPDELAEQFQEHLTRSRPPRVRRTTAWDRWWVLLAVVGMWAITWGVRRSSGLV